MKEKIKYILLFDGVCNLCNNSVQFVIKRDRKDKFRFASLQSNFGKNKLNELAIDSSKTDSIVLVVNNKHYTKSTAALNIAKQLKGLWPILYFFIIIPTPIRNIVYNWIAKNRYKWFGKKDSCMMPDNNIKKKFLDY